MGQVRVLYPSCRHSPQSLVRFVGGGSDGRVLVVFVGGGMLGGVVDRRGSSAGEVGESPIAWEGLGHVASFIVSGQNSLILSYRYHCRWRDSPDGVRTGGMSSLVGVQPPFFKIFFFSSDDPDLSFTNMQPGVAELKRK